MALPYVYLLSVMSMRFYHGEDPGYVNVYVSGYRDTRFEYRLPWEKVDRFVLLDERNNRTWRTSIRLSAGQEDACANRAIRLTSSDQITIQVARGKLQQTNTAAYTAIPLTEDSKEFLISSQPNSPNGLSNSQPIFVIGAGCNGGEVKVYNKYKGESDMFLFSRHLAAYEMLEIPAGQLNITGIYVSSDEPIVLYSGHQCGNVPVTASFCEPLFQQVAPFSLLGTEYILGPIKQRGAAGYTARIITTRPGSDVILATRDARVDVENANLRGCTLTDLGDVYNVQCRSPLAVGAFVDVHVSPSDYPLVVKCSAPCYAYQMNRGGTEPAVDVRTDPFMAVVPPLSQRTADVRFSTVSSFTERRRLVYRNFVTVIAPKDRTVLLDRIILPPSTGYTVGDYRIYSGEIQHGFHVVQTADGRATNLVVQVYGHGPDTGFKGQTAYGLPGAYFVSAQDEETPEITPKTPLGRKTEASMIVSQSARSTTPSGSPGTVSTTSIMWHSITNVISAKIPESSVSPSKAITTGILAAIVMAIIILVLCAIIMAIIFIILRRRRIKCKSLELDPAVPVLGINQAVVPDKAVDDVFPARNGAAEPEYWKIHHPSCVLKPKSDNSYYGCLDPLRPEDGRPVDESEYVDVTSPVGDPHPGSEYVDVGGSDQRMYEDLGEVEAHDNNSYDVLHPARV